MKHPRALVPTSAVALLLCIALISASGSILAQSAASSRTIETPVATLRISKQTCDLLGVHWKNPDLELIREPRLGENFRILLPEKGYEADYFYSRDQKVSGIAASPNGVVCTYDSLTNARETVQVKVRYRMQVIGQQIQFSIEVDNPTGRPLAEVMYGILGGQQGIGDRLDTESMLPGANANLGPRLFTQFQGGGYGGGNLGIRYDAASFPYPGRLSMGWMDVYNRKDDVGYYYADQDPDTRLTLLEVEMRPFGKSAVAGDSWPTPEEAQGYPIGITTGWLDMPYLREGTFKAGPVALEVHTGDWHTASGIYRSWFDRYFSVDRPRSWLREENAWQSIILSNGEDVAVHRFDELPKLAADAKKYGITTFEILGWDVGGIDRGYPQYEPNPQLGTPAEFRKALAEIRAMGVHPLIFSNIQFADTATPIFREWLQQFTVDGLWAPDWSMHGWGEGTISARAGLTRSNMTFVSPSHPQYRNYLIDQYLQLIRDGAEGFQFDKAISMDALDFNPTVPTTPDKSLVDGVLETYRELLSKGRAINPNLALASEIWYDRAFPYVDVSYMRMGQIDMNSTVLRYTFPEWTATIFGESPGDFNPMNNGMRYGLVWDLAPRHYNDSVDDPLTRPLARYVSELIRIRKRYANLLFYGRFNDTMGATVTGGGPNIRYSVFEPLHPASNSRACVIVNFGDSPASVEANLDGVTGDVVVAAPFQADRTATLPIHITIPPDRLVVVVKQ